jgi:hypothetical protein
MIGAGAGLELLESIRELLERLSQVMVRSALIWRALGFAMRTTNDCTRYNRSRLTYPSENEWRLVVPLILPAKRGGNKRTVDVREVVNGLATLRRQGLGDPILSAPSGTEGGKAADRWPGRTAGSGRFVLRVFPSHPAIP